MSSRWVGWQGRGGVDLAEVHLGRVASVPMSTIQPAANIHCLHYTSILSAEIQAKG